MAAHSAPVRLPDSTPTAKVTANALTGLTIADVIAIMHDYGYDVHPGVAGLVVAFCGFVAAYMKRSRPGELDR